MKTHLARLARFALRLATPLALVSAAGAQAGTVISQQQIGENSGGFGGVLDMQDHFGWSVAVAGDTVIVGAPYEDSSTTRVNTTPNESSAEAGAAYVFVRSGVEERHAHLPRGRADEELSGEFPGEIGVGRPPEQAADLLPRLLEGPGYLVEYPGR